MPAVSEEELLTHCRQQLADYKLPRQLVFRTELPLTPGRKDPESLVASRGVLFMNVQFDFSGRHVMVFGGTTGINLGIAQHYAMAGAPGLGRQPQAGQCGRGPGDAGGAGLWRGSRCAR